jgi:hypothetical protein
MFFIPLILVMWTTSEDWQVFPVPSKPFQTLEECEDALKNVKMKIMKHPNYRQGIASCVNFSVGKIT